MISDKEAVLSRTQLWDCSALEARGILWYPNEFVIRFVAKYVRKRLGFDNYEVIREVKRVLDLGCGHGRHVIMFAEQGYEVFGIDISEVAISFAREWVQRLQLHADLRVGTVVTLPYDNEFFDLVVSHGVLDHVYAEEAEKAVEEVHRVLRSNGLFYVDLISTLESGYGQGTEVAKNTYIVPEGVEAGVPQRFFELEHIRDLLEARFAILDVVLSQWEPVFGRGFSNLDKLSYPRAARYHVACQKK